MDTKELITRWRERADRFEKRANELGNCSAGLQLFTEATNLRLCADQLEGLS